MLVLNVTTTKRGGPYLASLGVIRHKQEDSFSCFLHGIFINMKQELQWFRDREMDTVIMITPEGKEVDAYIANKREAKYYFDKQEKGFSFKVKLRVSKVDPDKVCTGSCEG